MPDAQKAILIHDWLVANLAYDQYKVSSLGSTRAAAHTVDYDAFGTPCTIGTIIPGIHNINHGMYTRTYVTRQGWY